MKLFPAPTNFSNDPDACAGLLLEVVPAAMRLIRREVRGHASGLTVPQFRALGFIGRNRGANLTDVAAELGLTLSAVSRIVEGLVQRGYAARAEAEADRRHLTLRLTPAGEELLAEALKQTQARLAEALRELTLEERGELERSLRRLGALMGDR